MLSTVLKYLKHSLVAKKKHGIHSPFVFELCTKVFLNKKVPEHAQVIEKIRNELLTDSAEIEVEDYGAGSRKMNSSVRKIKNIAKHSLKPKRQAQLLYRIVDWFQPATMVEIGTSLGITSAYLALGSKNGHLHTLEGSQSIADKAVDSFEKLQLKNINVQVGNFNHTLPETLSKLDQVDFVFFDGNHRKEPTWNYFEQCLNKSHDASVFIFDDIYWSREMEEVWEMIKNHPAVTVSIDLFHFGLIFFHQHQSKEHFKVKY